MTNKILLYTSSILPIIWGTAHLFPTKKVVRGFGDISIDNKRIITMEWIIEGAVLIFIGTVIFTATAFDHTNVISKTIFLLSFIMLNALSVISIFTGSKVDFLPYKLCPVIFTGSSFLLFLGLYL